MVESKRLRVFLCHASQDKAKVRELYHRLRSEGWIAPWLDEEELLPGQDFDLEIYRAIRDTDAIIICLSTLSVAREGYVNREIRRALEIAQEKAEGAIYIIPLRFDDCNPSFEQLRKLHWVDYFTPNAHESLIKSLRARATVLKLAVPAREQSPINFSFSGIDLDLYSFLLIPPTIERPYPFWIGKYPVTNAQYERFLNSHDYANEAYWRGFLKFNEYCIEIGRWGNEGLDWLKKGMGQSKRSPVPRYWNAAHFGISNPDNPVVGVTWYEANAYCSWLASNWYQLAESRANSYLLPHLIRLPLDTEWIAAAGGEALRDRFPWDPPGKVTTDMKEIARRANVGASNIGHTTPVKAYPQGASPHGVMDMIGNVFEWQANYQSIQANWLDLRGGSWRKIPNIDLGFIRVGLYTLRDHPDSRDKIVGFRVIVLPKWWLNSSE